MPKSNQEFDDLVRSELIRNRNWETREFFLQESSPGFKFSKYYHQALEAMRLPEKVRENAKDFTQFDPMTAESFNEGFYFILPGFYKAILWLKK